MGSRKIEGEKPKNSFPSLALLLSLPVAQGWVFSVTLVATRSPHPVSCLVHWAWPWSQGHHSLHCPSVTGAGDGS